MRPANTMSLNDLTTQVTACQTWNNFAENMHNGYVPTLRPHAGRSKATKHYNEMVEELANRLEAMGFKVWRGTEKATK
jgi:hypothetical protein